MPRSVPILMYHRVAPQATLPDGPSRDMLELTTVTPEAFEQQMAWLSRRGYRTLTLDELLDHRDNGRDLPRRSVVITFDDGYQDCAENAVPVLRRYGFNAIFFLVAGEVGGSGTWDHDPYGWNFPLFDWDTARALKAEGFQFGAHTMNHPHLPEISIEEARREIAGSRQIIEDQLTQPVAHFCYPYGEYNDVVREIVGEAGFRTACSIRRGASPPDDDRLALRRVAVSGWDTMFDFRFRVRGMRPVRLLPRLALGKARRKLMSLRAGSRAG